MNSQNNKAVCEGALRFLLVGELVGATEQPRQVKLKNLAGSKNVRVDSAVHLHCFRTDYPPSDIASGSGTRRDVLGNVREPLFWLSNTMRLRPEPADGLDGRLESGLLLAENLPPFEAAFPPGETPDSGRNILIRPTETRLGSGHEFEGDSGVLAPGKGYRHACERSNHGLRRPDRSQANVGNGQERHTQETEFQSRNGSRVGKSGLSPSSMTIPPITPHRQGKEPDCTRMPCRFPERTIK